MAKYSVECPVCTSTYTVQLVGRQRDRQYKLENWDWTCDDCREKARQAENVKAAEANAEAGLPALTGTEKQVAWAETIRAAKIAEVDKIVDGYDARLAEVAKDPAALAAQDVRSKESGFESLADAFACAKAAAVEIINTPAASWWIDNRDVRLGTLILKQAEKVAAARKVTPAPVAALAEATIRPETPVTETVAEIRVHNASVEIIFPEKREDFWQIVKKQLEFQWVGSAWKRTLLASEGTPAARAAEAAHRLLRAGFGVRVFDPAIRQQAIEGTFEPEQTRWVKSGTKGAYAGWFYLQWKGLDPQLYNAARKLKGSKYDKPSVVVPAEQFEEVLDFAALCGFSLSPGARDLVEQARAVRDAALVASPAPLRREALPVPGEKPAPLSVPESVEVADEFKD